MRPLLLLPVLAFGLAAPPMGQGATLAGLRASVDADVSQADLRTIETGLNLAESYFSRVLGLHLAKAETRHWRIRVVATGQGDPLGGSDKSCCTALPATWARGPKLFLDVGHTNWRFAQAVYDSPEEKNLQLIVHEYTHLVEARYEAASVRGVQLPNWMAEGMAEYLAFEAMIWSGRMDRSTVARFNVSRAQRGGELSVPLSAFATNRGHVWDGHVGYVAVSGLVRQSGRGAHSLVDYLDGIAAGRSEPEAFEAAFGIAPRDFETRFEAWRKANRHESWPAETWN